MAEKPAIPVHIAVIMDGNGRWATQRGLPRVAGHLRGAQRVKEIVRAAQKAGVKVITLFAFSTENWKRSPKEVAALMRYFHDFIRKEEPGLMKNGVRLRIIGRRSKLPARVRAQFEATEKRTAGNGSFTMVLAVDYGARQEIVEAVKQACARCRGGELSPEDIDEDVFSSLLYTAGLPDPDLLIRTSGEQRLSNFLLWQCSYAEFYFAKKLWPDFGTAELAKALDEFARRRRRFGAA